MAWKDEIAKQLIIPNEIILVFYFKVKSSDCISPLFLQKILMEGKFALSAPVVLRAICI
jgi:hypothetical protein